ncbi:MAG: hypothetical protein JSU63_14495 [Phycisphaerales bacterium]|nr:MAG: hypothetical protein JSU63_14495 [Phycisphaerales bacterium]
MSIELHCPACSKLIRAPDEAGGKRGKCPYCKNSVYIPMPEDDGEIGLAPIDEEDQRRAEELRRESTQYIAEVGHQTEVSDSDELPPPPTPAPPPLPDGDVVDLGGEVGAFITAMRDSNLDEADQVTERLKQAGDRAADYVQGMLNDELPPQFEGVPPPLAQGFLKALLGRLS